MASIGLSEAARLTGRNQSTIHQAMKTGRLSYTKDEAGGRRIDVAELEPVFGINKVADSADHFSRGGNGASPASKRNPLQAMSRMNPKANA